MTLRFHASQEPRYIKHFTSKPFTNFFLRDEKMPMNVTGHSFQRREQREMQKVVCNILQFINDNGGFTITGWRRPGLKIDQGVDTPNTPYNKEPKKLVPSGDVTLHISHITPSDQYLLTDPRLTGLRYDASLLTGNLL